MGLIEVTQEAPLDLACDLVRACNDRRVDMGPFGFILPVLLGVFFCVGCVRIKALAAHVCSCEAPTPAASP
jgi:hypothetical protein